MATQERSLPAVKTEVFEGPLDLLLSLVEKRKLFINDISLSLVADEYVGALRREDAPFPLEQTSQFLVIAASLLLIKSRSLLPNLQLTDREEADIRDLSERLRVYERFRELARGLAGERRALYLPFERSGKKGDRVMRSKPIEPVFSPGSELSLEALARAMALTVAKLPNKPFLRQTTVEKTVRLEEMMASLSERVRTGLRLRWSELNADRKKHGTSPGDRAVHIEAIVRFLAILELVKRGALIALQTSHFSDIELENREIAVPRYG